MRGRYSSGVRPPNCIPAIRGGGAKVALMSMFLAVDLQH